jgi:FtsP/CotA-like multicopper oxidase with cupredoxin domain
MMRCVGSTKLIGFTQGVTRPVVAVNGQIPGPKIEANWGDTIGKHVARDAVYI